MASSGSQATGRDADDNSSSKSDIEENLADLRNFFNNYSPVKCRKSLLAGSTYRSDYLRFAKSNGGWEPVLVVLDGASLFCRKNYASPTVKAKFNISTTTKIFNNGHSCFSLESEFGTRFEFDALSEENRCWWVDSIKQNRAWIAAQEVGSPPGGPPHISAHAFTASGLPTKGSSFSDDAGALVRAWNYTSETPATQAHRNGTHQCVL